jgi:hypothetical protein
VYTVYALYSPSHTLSPSPHPSHWYQPGLSCSSLLFSDFTKEKKNYHICLFKIATQGVSFLVVPAYIHNIYYIHIYIIYYKMNGFISSIFLLSTLISSYSDPNSFKILYSFLYREYINHSHLLNFFLLYSPSLI